MNVLTTPINIPNVQRMRVVRVAPDADDSAVYITIEVQMTGALPYPRAGNKYTIVARNGTSTGIRASASPAGSDDRVEQFSVSTPTGFTDVFAANVGATIAIRDSAVETALVAAGLMPTGTIT